MDRTHKEKGVKKKIVWLTLFLMGSIFFVLPSNTTASGPQKVAVILFNFQNNTSQPWTESQVRAITFTNTDSVNAYYQEVSYGSLSLTGKLQPDGDIYGWYTIPFNNTSCNLSTWSNSAKTIAQNGGADLTGYDNFIYAFPNTSACGFSGNSTVSGTTGESWLNGIYDTYIVGHEFGHTLGTNHASALNCFDEIGTRVTYSNNCTNVEYGDRFDIMGNTPYINSTPMLSNHMNAFRKGQVGFLPDTNLQTVTVDGNYNLAPLESSLGGIQSIRIPRDYDTVGNVLRYYYLDFRQPTGTFNNFVSTDPIANGITIRLASPYILLNSQGQNIFENSRLLDTTPSTADFTDSALAIGQSFTDPLTGTSITTESLSSSSATANIHIGNSCIRSAHSLTFAPTSQGGSPGQPLNYTATITNNDSAACDKSSFNVVGSLQNGWIQNSSPTFIQLSPGQSGNITITITSPTNANNGNYLISETSQNVTNFLFTTSGSLTYAVGTDFIPPTTPTNLAAIAPDHTHVDLTWTPSSDNIAVLGYKIYRNGTLRGDVSINSFTDSAVIPGTTYTYSVQAYDAAQNLSTPSSPATVTVPNAPGQPHIVLSPTNLTFNATVGDENGPAPQAITISNTGTTTLNWSGNTDQTWCHIDLVGGSIGVGLNTSFSVWLDAPFIQGVFNCIVTITDPNADNNPQNISVVYDIAGSGDTTPPSTPENLVAAAPNSTQVDLIWDASVDNVEVIGYLIYRDGEFIGSSATDSYSDLTVIGGSTYSYRVQAYDAAFNFSDPSNFANVTVPNPDMTAPTTLIMAPTNGANVGINVVISADANDNVAVDRVEFYLDAGVLLGIDTTAPYSIPWNSSGFSLGNHTIFAKAFDASGNTGSSPVINVNVDNINPITTVTAPTNGANVSGTGVTIRASASDNIGVTRVEFYRDAGILLGTDTTPNPNYSIVWNSTTVIPGSHTLFSKAYDNAGNVTTSSTITVNILDVTPPVTAVTNPAAGSTVLHSSVVTIEASASDNVGVTRVEFYVSGSIKCTDTVAPFSCNWTVPASIGTNYNLKTKAFDAANKVGTSPIITVTSN